MQVLILILQRLVGGVEEWGVWLDCSLKWLSAMPHYVHHLRDLRKKAYKVHLGACNRTKLKIMCQHSTYLTWYEYIFRQKNVFCLYPATLCELTSLRHSINVLIKCMGVVKEQFSNESHGEFYLGSVKLCDCNYRVAGIWQDLQVFQTSPFPPHPSHSARRN